MQPQLLANTTHWKVGLVGPCGAGKTTLAHLLAARIPNSAWIKEFEAPAEIHRADRLTPTMAQRYQEKVIESRCQDIRRHAKTPILILDRTFEEDREVFLPIYARLGFLETSQCEMLKRLSLEAEASVGIPDFEIMLTASREMLKERLLNVSGRPPWVLDTFDLQYDLYAEWQTRQPRRRMVFDVSNLDPDGLANVIQPQLTRLLEIGMPTLPHTGF